MRSKTRTPLPAIITALIFFCNPYLAGLDLLPDFVGYLILMSLLGRVALWDESLNEAKRLFGRLACLSAVRMFAYVWVIASPNDAERPTMQLLLCFAAGVLELILLLPACRHLFHGLAYLGTRLGGDVVLSTVGAMRTDSLQRKLDRLNGRDTPVALRRRAALKHRIQSIRPGGDVADRACISCQTFAVLRTALCVLPELVALTDASYREGVILVNWYRYIGLFRALGLLFALGIGIWWLVRTISYCRYAARDTAFWQAVRTRCDEDSAAHPERVPARKLRRACLLCTLSLIFCLHFFANGLDLFPGFITPLLLLPALQILRDHLPRRLLLIGNIWAVLHTLLCSFTYGITLAFFARYDLAQYERSEELQRAYTAVQISAAVEAVCMAVMLALIWIVARTLIRRYVAGNESATYLYTGEQLIERRRRAVLRSLWPLPVLGGIAAVMHVVYFLLLPEHETIWFLDTAITAVFCIFSALRLRNAVDKLDTVKMAESVSAQQ